jgi:hypothetical protein
LHRYDDAERGYRRAHAIAVASLSPGHPFAATSLKNLVDFCAAHDIPIWKPPAAKSDDETSSFRLELAPAPEEPEMTSAPLVIQRTGSTRRTIALAALGVAAIVVLVFAMQGRGASSPSVPLSRAETTPPAAIREPEPTAALEKRPEVPEQAPEPAPPKPREIPVTSSASVMVLNAQLCIALEKRGSPDWQCTSASGDLQPGMYIFYTRLLTNTATAVEHRWYLNGRVHQTMKLRVTPTAGGGYRTFSSNTVSPERTGDWKVEVRAADGSVLHEEQFVVR